VLLFSSNNSSDSIASSLPAITVKDKSILELGAGTALPSLTSALLDARSVTMTDYPSDALISNIRQNVELNIPEGLRGKVEVWGHCWGELEESDDDKATVEMSNWVSRRKATYDVVIAADCMWMGDQHHNLARSIHHFLAAEGKVLAIAGFHTGRQKVADFFRICQEEGLKLESIVEMDVEGTLRDWKEDRGREDPVERKRWLTVGVLGK
jgi:EEF1A N-terminal glycine/lysine methyltransferase